MPHCSIVTPPTSPRTISRTNYTKFPLHISFVLVHQFRVSAAISSAQRKKEEIKKIDPLEKPHRQSGNLLCLPFPSPSPCFPGCDCQFTHTRALSFSLGYGRVRGRVLSSSHPLTLFLWLRRGGEERRRDK